jgi:hypothetical protein
MRATNKEDPSAAQCPVVSSQSLRIWYLRLHLQKRKYKLMFVPRSSWGDGPSRSGQELSDSDKNTCSSFWNMLVHRD